MNAKIITPANIFMHRRRIMLVPATFGLLISVFFGTAVQAFAQKPSETPPPPSAPRSVQIPKVREFTLPNGLKIVVVRKKGLPLVTVSMLIKKGAAAEGDRYAGLAAMTAALLRKGTALRSATEIAEHIEFLGARINTGAGWNSSTVTLTIMRDKLPNALAIMADSITRPSFPASEVRLIRKQTLDGLSVNLKRPGTVLAYVAGRFTYGEHSPIGTPESISRIRRRKIVGFHNDFYHPENSVLVFTGDITEQQARGYGRLFFGGWQKAASKERKDPARMDIARTSGDAADKVIGRLLVVDLPDSGQAAVGYAKKLAGGRIVCGGAAAVNCRTSRLYYPATVLNSVLGGGYSARLNQEIRIKRGLSYGARSGFAWRSRETNFNANTQTKNESAAEVAELIRIEIEKLSASAVSDKELTPRKAVVTGGFSRGLQTNAGLAARIRDLYLYGVSPDELNSYMKSVGGVSGDEIRTFASDNLKGGDLIIVGDAKLFMDDLTKRFPNRTIEVIRSKDLDLNRSDLRKRGRP